MTADSDLIAKGRAKHLGYAWGTADARVLQQMLDRTSPEKCIAVHIADLAEGLRLGTLRMFEEADGDRDLANRLSDRGGRFFAGMSSTFQRVWMPSGLPAARSNTR
jgi:hypothetical protein